MVTNCIKQSAGLLRRGWVIALACCCLGAAGPLLAAKPPQWTVVKTPHFTVLSAGRTADAQYWAKNLERFRLALSVNLPVDAAKLPPVVVVIFPSATQFREYKILQHGKPAEVDGYFARMGSINVISLAMGEGYRDELKGTIFHEATHWGSSARSEVLPLWLEEGLAEVFSTFTADDKTFTVGNVLVEHMRYLRRVGVPSLAQLTATKRDSVEYNDTDRVGQFYAGSWLLVHWAMFGKDGPGPDSLVRYVSLLQEGQDAETAFTTAFHGNYKAVETALNRYRQSGGYNRREFPLPAEPLGLAPPRKATESEVDYALGAVLLGAQRPQEALPRLLAVVKRDANDPTAWEAVGDTQMLLGNKGDALAAFNHAIATGSKTALVWCNRAVLRQELEYPRDAMQTTPADFGHMAEDFRQAIKLDPRCAPAYQGLVGMVYRVEPADPADTGLLEEGRKIFPTDPWIKAGLIIIRLRGEAPEAAGELKTLLRDGSAQPMPVRELITSVLEQAKLKVVARDMARLQQERRFTELVAELDAVLKDGDVASLPNQQELRRLRGEFDRMGRLQEAVAAYNAGRRDEAAAMLRKLKAETPVDGIVHRETVRLLKAME